jgi:hypothetical protein
MAASNRLMQLEMVVGARTFWQAPYDVESASVEVSFYVDDVDGRSVYTDPIPFAVNER